MDALVKLHFAIRMTSLFWRELRHNLRILPKDAPLINAYLRTLTNLGNDLNTAYKQVVAEIQEEH